MPSLATLPHDLAMFAKYHLVRRVYDHPAKEPSLGIVELPFELDEYAARLRAFDGDRFEVETLERVTYADREHPILRIRSRRAAPRTLLVLAGVHGNEHAGLLAVPSILEAFDEASVRLVVLTPVNPVGAVEGSRYNAEGYDINRDFERFLTPEARLVRALYEEERPDFVVSLHEGPQDATFMFANRFVDRAVLGRLLDALSRGGTELARKDYFGQTLSPPGAAPMGRVAWLANALWAKSLGMKATIMFSDDRAIPEVVLESSWRLADAELRVRPHVDLVAAVVAELAR